MAMTQKDIQNVGLKVAQIDIYMPVGQQKLFGDFGIKQNIWQTLDTQEKLDEFTQKLHDMVDDLALQVYSESAVVR